MKYIKKISLMGHIPKILFRINMMQVRNKIKLEIADEKCGFAEEKVQQIQFTPFAQRFSELWKDKNLFFIDFTKAFDKVRHDEIITQLIQLKIDGKDVQVIKNMHREKTAATRGDWEITSFK